MEGRRLNGEQPIRNGCGPPDVSRVKRRDIAEGGTKDLNPLII